MARRKTTTTSTLSNENNSGEEIINQEEITLKSTSTDNDEKSGGEEKSTTPTSTEVEDKGEETKIEEKSDSSEIEENDKSDGEEEIDVKEESQPILTKGGTSSSNEEPTRSTQATTVNVNISKLSDGETVGYFASQAYFVCITEAGTGLKVATSPNNVIFTDTSLETGITVHVKFTYANIQSSISLQVGSSTAKTVSPAITWEAGAIISFTYDGTNWIPNDYVNSVNSITFGSNTVSPSFTGNADATSAVNTMIDNKVDTAMEAATFMRVYVASGVASSSGVITVPIDLSVYHILQMSLVNLDFMAGSLGANTIYVYSSDSYMYELPPATSGTYASIATDSLDSTKSTITFSDSTSTWYKSSNLSVVILYARKTVTVTSLSVNRDGTYTAPTGTAYNPVTSDVESTEFGELLSDTWGDTSSS